MINQTFGFTYLKVLGCAESSSLVPGSSDKIDGCSKEYSKHSRVLLYKNILFFAKKYYIRVPRPPESGKVESHFS